MAEPWIRVHANLIDKPVVDRASHELGVAPHEAIGLLVQFWGAVSQHATNGAVAERSDAQLERWAGWARKRGRFAAFIRAHHLDADGRVNEWDEYAGKLETRREHERERKRLERERRTKEAADRDARRRGTAAHGPADHPADDHADHPSDVTRTVTQTVQPARANETRRDDTRVVVDDDEERAKTAAAIVSAVTDPPALTAIYLAIWANGAVTERWGEQPSPYTASQAETIALDLQTAGVEWSVAKAAIYRQCRDSRRPDPPKSPAYFGPGVIKAWNQELARRAAVESGERAPPRAPPNTNGRHEPRSTPPSASTSPYAERFKT